MHSIWEITKEWQRRHHSIWQISYLQNCKAITWRKSKNRMTNVIPNIPNYLHLSGANLLQYEFHHLIINFIIRFPWHFEISLCRLLVEDLFWSTKMRTSEYVCKTYLKELGILLKCRETYEEFLAACNSSKNTGLPKKIFTSLLQLYFKNINFETKTRRCLLCWLLWIQN